MTPKQATILKAMRKSGETSPTKTGLATGKDYQVASSWFCSGIPTLVQTGYIRLGAGGRYHLTAAGRNTADDLIEAES